MWAFDRHLQFFRKDSGLSAMVDVTMGEKDLFDRCSGLSRRSFQPIEVAAGIDEGASASSPCTIASVQFCCSGVTGMIAARSGGWAALFAGVEL